MAGAKSATAVLGSRVPPRRRSLDRRLRRLKSFSIRGDNPMIQNLIAAIYHGIARFPAGVVKSLILMQNSRILKTFPFPRAKFLIKLILYTCNYL